MDQVLFKARENKLFFYSPFNFIRKIGEKNNFKIVIQDLHNSQVFKCKVDENAFEFYYEWLEWDTDFFGIKTVKLKNVLFESSDLEKTIKALNFFKKFIKNGEKAPVYLFIEIPSEDIQLIQTLTASSFKLIETRLTYFNDKIQEYNFEQRFKVRKAEPEDIDNLMRVAALMRNEYDRFHADKTFDLKIADSFLSKYVGEAVKGFSDIVLVPGAENLPSDSFLTGNYLEKHWKSIGVNASKMVLSAVLSETNRGWYVKLISEMSYHFKHKGVDVAFMNTQSANRAVIKTWEKLGFKFGSSTHILSITL